MGSRFPYYLLADSQAGRKLEADRNGDDFEFQVCNDTSRKGFVYERARRVTLESIAKNPSIVEGMTQSEIDATIWPTQRPSCLRPTYRRPQDSSSGGPIHC